MKIEVEITDDFLQKICTWMEDYEDITVTVEELKANPKLADFLKYDIELLYHENGSDGFENMSLADDLGYEPAEDD